jgi:hypothetical protein
MKTPARRTKPVSITSCDKPCPICGEVLPSDLVHVYRNGKGPMRPKCAVQDEIGAERESQGGEA